MAGTPAFFVPPSRPRGADQAERRDATEGQEGGTGKMRFAIIRDYSRWDISFAVGYLMCPHHPLYEIKTRSQSKALVASLSTCLAKVVDYVSDPPRLRPPLRVSLFANLRFALRLGSTTLACCLTSPHKLIYPSKPTMNHG